MTESRSRTFALALERPWLIWAAVFWPGARLKSLEWVEGAPEVIDIEGGLKDDATGDFATAGDVLVEREDGELIEAFRARARARAFGLGSSHVVFGGLTPVKYEDEPT